ncbi:MAG: MAPEG family protein [Burkholderiaceae bacterium]
MLNNEQRGVLRGMLTALAVCLIGFVTIFLWNPMRTSLPLPASTAIGLSLEWDILLMIALAINIALIARHRFFTPEDINGSALTTGTGKVRIFQATLQNTVEQTALAFPTHLIWAVTMPQQWQGIVPLAAIFFFSGRVFFWRGYASGAAARSFGFALTFYPSLIMLLLLGVYFFIR